MIHLQQRCTEKYYTKTPVHSSVNMPSWTALWGKWEQKRKEERVEGGAGRRHKNKYETLSALKEAEGRHSHLLNERSKLRDTASVAVETQWQS